jgi:hypothetical protein
MARRYPSPSQVAIACLAIMFAMTPAKAESPDGLKFHHGGSVMSVRTSGTALTIHYARPRAGLAVTKGTRLFTGALTGGTWEDGKIEGEAAVFSKGCKSAPYTVSGTIRDEGPNTIIELSGAAPVRAPGSCSVTRYSTSSSNSHLIIESGIDE